MGSKSRTVLTSHSFVLLFTLTWMISYSAEYSSLASEAKRKKPIIYETILNHVVVYIKKVNIRCFHCVLR